jgi:hypothetical protein
MRLENPVKLAIDNSFWWLLFFPVVAGLGIFAQIQANRTFEIDTYNRLSEITQSVHPYLQNGSFSKKELRRC